VIVHAYQQWGPACLDRLNGDFAFAVWDREAEELFLARDRFGVRPLFVADYGGDFCFASEAKALLRHPRAPRELDPAGLVETFTTWANLPERSSFAGIRELAPAHYARVGPDGLIEERRWWDLDFGQPDPPASDEELIQEVQDLLSDATRIRLRADVPVGAYVSGGLDSSATAALARRHLRHDLTGFGVGFADERFDESAFQDRIVKELGVDMTRVTVDGPDIAELLPRAVELAEKPTLRTALVPLLRLSRAVQDAGLKVVLTGEGADELFGGYDLFREDKVRRFWARDPQSKLRPLLFTRLNAFMGQDLGRAAAFLSRFYAKGLTETDDPLYSHRIRFDNTSRILRLLRPDLIERARAADDPLARLVARLPGRYERFTPLGKAQYVEIQSFLEGYLLHSQGDRMLMGHSIEGRFPFLDFRVAECAARLPDRLRLRGLEEKYALRRAVAPLLPREVWERKKQPYRAPIGAVFVGERAPEYVRELLDPARLESAGIFDPEAVRRVLAKFEATGGMRVSETDEMALVGTISTMLLHQRLVAEPALAPEAVPTRVVVGDRVELVGKAPAEVAA
jgi:asparagine synthase (glutamine-hydrolysing)